MTYLQLFAEFEALVIAAEEAGMDFDHPEDLNRAREAADKAREMVARLKAVGATR